MDKDLLYRFFEGRASVEEMRLVKEWSEASEENSKLLRRERKLFNAIILSGRLESSDGQTTLRKKRNHFVREFLKIASVVAITVGITAALFSIGEDKEDMNVAMQTITVPAGQRVNLDLPDGSNVWLNAGTTMKYPVSFMKGKREVILDGEAYFEVAKDSLNRFVVQAGDLAVEALGTSFNVKAYEEDNQAVVTLFQGKVKTSVGRDEAFLLPDQAVTYLKNKGQLKKSTLNDAYRACLWRNNELAFNDEALSEIAVLLNRMYNIQVVFKSEKVKALRFTGVITNNSLDNIIELISLTSPIIYTSKGDTIIIDEKK